MMIGLYFEAFVIGIATGAVYAIVAMGFNLVFGVLNVFNFAFGAVMMVATYGALLIFRFVTDSFWLSCLFGLAVATAVGLVVERVAVRPLKGNQWTTAVATVGAAFFLENLIAFVTRPTPQDFPRPIESVTFYEIVARIEISNLQIVLVLLSVGLMLAVVGFLRFTSLGISIRVVGQSPDIAKSVGIDVQRVVVWTFAISSAIGGAAGIINSVAYSSTYPYVGTFLGLKGIVILIVAGVGNMRGALAVGLVLGLLESYAVILGDPNYRDIVAYGGLVLILAFRPGGLFGEIGRASRSDSIQA